MFLRSLYFIKNAVWILFLSSQLASAASAKKIELDGVLRKYLSEAPQLKELNEQVGLSDLEVKRRFLPNEPSLVYGSDGSDVSKSYGLQLNFGFPGKAFALSRLDKALARKQRSEVFAKRLDLARVISQAYLECAADQAIYGIRESSLNDLEAFLTSLKARRGIIQTEKLSLEIETQQARQELLTARDQREVSCRTLATLMNDSGDGKLEPVLPEDIGTALIAEFGAMTPEQTRAISAMDVATANLSVAWWNQMPDFSLNFSRKEFLADPPAGVDRWVNVYGVSVTLPLLFPFYERVDASRARSQAAIERSDAQLQKIQAESDRAEAARTFQRSRKYLRDLRSKQLPLGQSLLETAYSAYRAGQLGYAEMIMSRKTLIDLKVKDVELRSTIISARLKCLDECDKNLASQ